MYDHIIVPFDGSERAQEATRIAADIGRRLGGLRLHVVTGTDSGSRSTVQALKDRAMDMSDETVDVWVEANRSPVRAIGTVIDHRPGSLLCMATSARSGVLKAVYGSLAEQLLRTVDVPVILIGPRCDPPEPYELRHLVVCIDEDPISHGAIPVAADLAHEHDLPITLLHVASRDRRGPAFDLRPFAAELEKWTRVVDPVTVVHDHATDGILDVLARSGGALVVMASHARSGFGRLVRGSVVTEVVRESPLPVLVVRGDGADGHAEEPVGDEEPELFDDDLGGADEGSSADEPAAADGPTAGETGDGTTSATTGVGSTADDRPHQLHRPLTADDLDDAVDADPD